MVRERGAAAQARSKRRRILAKFVAHVGSECVRCAMLLLGAVLDMTCAQRHAFEKYKILFPTFCLRLPLSVRDELFGNGFHARIGAAILPASSSGCEWYCLPSASQHHVDGQISGHYIPTVNDWEWIPRSRRGRAPCGVVIRVPVVLCSLGAPIPA